MAQFLQRYLAYRVTVTGITCCWRLTDLFTLDLNFQQKLYKLYRSFKVYHIYKLRQQNRSLFAYADGLAALVALLNYWKDFDMS